MIKIGINGFNKITKKIIFLMIKYNNINIVGINLNNNININNFIYILKYNLLKKFNNIKIIKIKNNIIINKKYNIRITNHNNIKKIKWYKINVKYIIETNNNLNYKYLFNHIKYGKVKNVILTTSNIIKKIPIILLGINHKLLTNKYKIISYSTSFINCIIPILKILHRKFIIKNCFITNIKSLKIFNNYFKKYNFSFILKNTNISKQINNIYSEFKNKIYSNTIIIPNSKIPLINFKIEFKKKIKNSNKIINIIKYNSKNEFSGILGYINKNIIYNNIIDDNNVSIIDINSIKLLNNKYLNITSYYKNDNAYCKKIIDFIKYIDNNI
ncbi:MAG: hypothetical protein RDO_1210 [Flavobacteriales endosymbiont of Rhyzopertha dominica]|nr:MAG: hypothetical protein NHG05_00620 [Candidatus Shikimatogenerans bostrichidophilus]